MYFAVMSALPRRILHTSLCRNKSKITQPALAENFWLLGVGILLVNMHPSADLGVFFSTMTDRVESDA
jgi:hypothetical protein